LTKAEFKVQFHYKLTWTEYSRSPDFQTE